MSDLADVHPRESVGAVAARGELLVGVRQVDGGASGSTVVGLLSQHVTDVDVAWDDIDGERGP